jgi:hypothetical protein
VYRPPAPRFHPPARSARCTAAARISSPRSCSSACRRPLARDRASTPAAASCSPKPRPRPRRSAQPLRQSRRFGLSGGWAAL